MVVKDLDSSYDIAQQLISAGDFENATIVLDNMLLFLANRSSKGVERIQGTRIDIWKERVWFLLETNNLINCN